MLSFEHQNQPIGFPDKRTGATAVLLAIVALMSIVVMIGSCDAETSGSYGDDTTWTLDADGTLIVSGTGTLNKEIEWNELDTPITSIVCIGFDAIGECAFESCVQVTCVSLPDNLTSIGSAAFLSCTSLEHITIPDSLEYIGEYAFGETLLKSLTIPSSMTSISDYAFAGCGLLESIAFHDYVTTIGIGAFSDCAALSIMDIPDSVDYIGECAFNGCSSLKTLDIPDSVDYIGEHAFSNCESLKSIQMPNSLAFLGYGAFENCRSLETVDMPGMVTTMDGCVFSGCTSLAEIDLPDSMTYISYSTFAGCKALRTITIPESVTTIGNSAFRGCTSLESVAIPESVTTIESSAFQYCTSLESGAIPESVTTIEGETFYGCTSLESVAIPESVTTIGSYSFWRCTSLVSVVIPESVTIIGNNAFERCVSLVSISLPSTLSSIGNNSFLECYKLVDICNDSNFILSKGSTDFGRVAQYAENIYSSNSGSSILRFIETFEGKYIFAKIANEYCLLSKYEIDGEVALPSSPLIDDKPVTDYSVYNHAFYCNDRITTVTVPDSVTSIGDWAFCSCTNMVSITLSESIVEISNFMLNNCSALESICIPESVTQINKFSFVGCDSLKAVVFPNNLTYVDPDSFYLAFYDGGVQLSISAEDLGGRAFLKNEDGNLMRSPTVSIIVECPEAGYVTGDGLYFYGSTVTLTAEPYAGNTFSGWKEGNVILSFDKEYSFVITDDITLTALFTQPLGQGTCGDDLTWVVSSNGALEISGNGPMYDYSSPMDVPWYEYKSSIDVVNLKNGVSSVGSYAFYEYDGLSSLFIGNGLLSIGEFAFYGCMSINQIALPITVFDIGTDAFGNLTFKDASGVEMPSPGLSDLVGNAYQNDGQGTFTRMLKISATAYGPDDPDITGAGFYKADDMVTLTAAPVYGWTFTGWFVDDISVSSDPSYTFVATADATFSAIFSENIDAGTCGNDLEWVLCENGILKITGTGDMSYYASDIPWSQYAEQILGVTIENGATSICNSAFSYCENLISIDIPDSVSRIEPYAFSNCPALVTVRLPESLTEISHGTFFSCSGLESVYIPDLVTTIDNYAFFGCSSLRSVTMPDSVESLGHNCFRGCSSLTHVSLPESAECDTDYLFYNCSSLESVSLPESLTSIGEHAFYNCSSLKNVTIPESVNYIGGHAFYNCSSLESVSLPESLTSIGEHAFYNCSSLESVSLPESLTSIGGYAFFNCASLKTVTIPESVNYIGGHAFYQYGSLDVYMPALVSSIGNDAFSDPLYQVTITIEGPEGCSTSGSGYYSKNYPVTVNAEPVDGCRFLCWNSDGHILDYSAQLSFTIMEDVALTAVFIQGDADIEGICGDNMLWYLENETLTIVGAGNMYSYGSATSSPWYAYRSIIAGVIIEEGVLSIGNYAFYGCSNLSSVTMKDVQTIGNRAFARCVSLESVDICEGMTTIKAYAFYNCTLLESLYIPTSVKTIETKAFEGITFLDARGYAIKPTVDNMSGNLFLRTGDSTLTKTYTVSAEVDGPSVCSVSGAGLFLPWQTITLTAYPGEDCVFVCWKQDGAFVSDEISYSLTVTGDETYTAVFRSVLNSGACGENAEWTLYGDGEMTISGMGDLFDYDSAKSTPWYKNQDAINRLTICEGIASVGNYSFYGCSELSSVIMEGVETIGNRAFARCTSLESISFGDRLSTIGGYAFYGCTSLGHLEFPSSLESVSQTAFNGLTFLDGSESPMRATSENLAGRSFVSTDHATLTKLYEIAIIVSSGHSSTAAETSLHLPGDTVTLVAPSKERMHFVAWILNNMTISTDPACDVLVSGDALYTAILEPAVNVLASGCCDDGLEWTLFEDGYLVIEGTGSMQDYERVSPPWLSYSSSIRHIVIGEGVDHIGKKAFLNCISAISAKLPSSLSSIDEGAFYGCLKLIEVCNDSALDLTSTWNNGCVSLYAENVYSSCEGDSILIETNADGITLAFAKTEAACTLISADRAIGPLSLPTSICLNGETIDAYTIRSYAFYGFSELESIAIPESVTSIGEYAFYGCSALEYVTIEGSIQSVNRFAFYECPSLIKMKMPESVTSIGEYAFYGCSALESVSLPDGLLSIGENAFYGCCRLIEICNDSQIALVPGSLDNGLVAYYAENVYSSDEGSSILTEAEIPGATLVLAEIDGSYALVSARGASGSLDIPASVNLDGEAEITSIRGYAFYGCSDLKSVAIPESVTSIGECAFYGCSALESVSLPDGLLSIGENALCGCESLRSVSIPDTVTSVGHTTFRGCSSLEYIYIGKSVAESLYLDDCPIRIAISGMNPDSQTFRNHQSLESVMLLDSVTHIQPHSFEGCTSLSTVVMSDSVEYIGENAFCDCYEMNSITIPSSVLGIYSNAFSGCYKLIEVCNNSSLDIVGGSVSNGLVAYYAENVYSSDEGSSILTEAEIPGATLVLAEIDGSYALVSARGASGSLDIPASVNLDGEAEITSIRGYAFYGYSSLESVSLPESISSIDDYAFCRCAALESISLPDGLLSIGESAFNECVSLKSVSIPDSVTSIGNYAFEFCESLKSIKIPDSITSIGCGTFENCTSLSSIDLPQSLVVIGDGSFNGCCLEEVVIPDSVETIESYAFEMCPVNFLTIGNSVSHIGSSAFYGCNMKSLVIPDSVTTIEGYAFGECINLDFLYIGKSLIFVEPESFENVQLLNSDSSAACIDETLAGSCFIRCDGELTRVEIGRTFMESGLIYAMSSFEPAEVSVTGCTSNVQDVVIPSCVDYYSKSFAVTKIESKAFYRNASIRSVDFGNVMSVGSKAFVKCTSLEHLTIPGNVKTISSHAFYGCDNLHSLSLEDGIKTLEKEAFGLCTSLTSVEFCNTLESIGSTAFSGYSFYTLGQNVSPTTKHLNGLTFVRDDKGNLCSTANIGDVVESENILYMITSTGERPEAEATSYIEGIEEAHIADFDYHGIRVYITEVSSKAFYGCKTLRTLHAEGCSIGYKAFANCSALERMELASVPDIGQYAFANCSSLERADLGDGLASVGKSAFSGCASLASIGFPDTLGTVGDTAFFKCSFYDAAGTPLEATADDLGGRAFSGNGDCRLYSAPEAGDAVTFEGVVYTVTSVGDSAEAVASSFVEGVEDASISGFALHGFQYHVTGIASKAFYGCKTLRTLHAEGCSIGYKAFANCSALERMELASVPDIGQYAFANCSSLERADLGDCLASVGKSAFSGCTAICSISFPDVLETVGETAFHGLKFYAHDGTTALSPTPANLSGKTFEGTSKALVQTA